MPVTMFLVKGVKLQGIVPWFDNFSILLRRDGQSQLVYKHAISTIMPSQPVDAAQFGSGTDSGRKQRLLQDVFLKVHKGLPYFRGESKLSTWIYRIVINVVSQERPELATVSLDEEDDDRPRREPGSEDRAFGDLAIKDRLHKAIERLPVPYQVLVNGHYM